MEDWLQRERQLLGDQALDRIREARVAVVGLGGVGAYAAEMLVRAGLGHILIVDSDTVAQSNLNRQILALHSTLGRAKAEVLRERLLDINPSLDISVSCEYLCEKNVAQVLGVFAGMSADNGLGPAEDSPVFVVDAIDTLSPKIALIRFCLDAGIRIVSSMGSGAKMDLTSIRIDDLSKTRECPLAHQLRKRLHRLGILGGFKCVYSVEKPIRSSIVLEESENKKSQVGTISYLPAAFGCACAQAVIEEIADF